MICRYCNQTIQVNKRIMTETENIYTYICDNCKTITTISQTNLPKNWREIMKPK